MSVMDKLREAMKPEPRPPLPVFISPRTEWADVEGELIAHYEVKLRISMSHRRPEEIHEVIWRPKVDQDVAAGEPPLRMPRSLQRQLIRLLYDEPVGTRFKGRMSREGSHKQFTHWQLWKA